MDKTIAWVFGVVLVALGVLGFVPAATTADGILLGIFQVDTLHNIVNLALGALAIMAALDMGLSRSMYFKGAGIVLLVVGVLGIVGGDSILGLIATNMAASVLQLVAAAVFLYAGFMWKGSSSSGSMSSNPVM